MKSNEIAMTIENWADLTGIKKGNENVISQVHVLFSECVELVIGIDKLDAEEMADGLGDIKWMVVLLKHISDLDLHVEFDIMYKHVIGNNYYLKDLYENYCEAILQSNWSKIITDESATAKHLRVEEAIQASIAKYADLGVAAAVRESSQGYYTLYCTKDVIDNNGVQFPKGKILKPVTYNHPSHYMK